MLTRPKITFKNKTEQHASSGIIISTSAGSTGWPRSIFNMAYGVTNMFEKNLTPKQPKLKENNLLFVVREPLKSMSTQTELTAGVLRNNTLKIESFMPNNGIIFSDGVEKYFLNFNSGSIVEIGMAKETANMVLKA